MDAKPITIEAALDAAYAEKNGQKRLNTLINIAASCSQVASGKGVPREELPSRVADFLYRDMKARTLGANTIGPMFIALLAQTGVNIESAKDVQIVNE